jgi:hypothetical protein
MRLQLLLLLVVLLLMVVRVTSHNRREALAAAAHLHAAAVVQVAGAGDLAGIISYRRWRGRTTAAAVLAAAA